MLTACMHEDAVLDARELRQLLVPQPLPGLGQRLPILEASRSHGDRLHPPLPSPVILCPDTSPLIQANAYMCCYNYMSL